MTYHYIYKTINLINNKIYVGQRTSTVPCSEDKYMGSGVLFKKCIKKYGKENFKKELIEYCEKHQLDDKEIFWIDKLNSMNRLVGYNLCKGGGTTLGLVFTEKQKENVRKSLIGNKRTLGFKHTDKTKEKMKIAQTGRKQTQETKEKCRNNCFKGKHHTEKVKEATRNRMMGNTYFKGHKLSEEQKDVLRKKAIERVNKGIIPFKGKKHKEETLIKLSERHKNRERVTCPHCNLILDVSNAKRWHFDNCKYKSSQV